MTEETPKHSPARAARILVRSALKAALATIDRRTGHPYASLVTVATLIDATPVILISRLAYHTHNLAADPRASLLFDGTSPAGDPLAGGRVTLIGEAHTIDDADARRRFLARHPAAQMYVDFPDFAFFALRPATSHYVGGFGRIVDLEPAALMLEAARCRQLREAGPDIIAHMNAEHTEALSLYATRLLGAAPGDWRMTALDPEGIDIATETQSLRLEFEAPAEDPDAVRREFVRLATAARAAPDRGNGGKT